MQTRCLNCMKEYDDSYEVCPHCGFIVGTPPKEPYHLYTGIKLQGRYVIGTVVGFGGFGIIYRAWDEQLDTMVAIKEFYPAGIVQRIPGTKEVIVYTGNSKKEFENGVERFLDEARNMAKFSTHPNIMNVYNFFEENNTAYIVMEFLHGVSLKQYVKAEGGKLPVEQAKEIIINVCEALKELHKENIIHRDISPDNIFICEDGRIKLIDFGAARFSTGEEEKTLSIILKPGFAPPEQYQSKSKQGPWTDIYALSASFYRIITGVVPEESVNRMIEDNLKVPIEFEPAMSQNLSNTIMKGMALTQELRFHNVQDFQDAILDKKKIVDLKKELKKRRKRRVIGIAIVSVLLIAGGLYGYHMFRDKREEVELPPTTITMWVPSDQDELEDTVQMYEDMAAVFLEAQPAVTLEITAIPTDEYAEKLNKAKDNNELPVIYASEYADEELLQSAADLSDIFDYINISDYYFLKKYKEYYPSQKQLPLGYTVPVVYVRRGMGVNIDTVVISDYELLRSNATEDIKGELSYYIEPSAQYCIWSSFDGGASSDGMVSEEVYAYQTAYQNELASHDMTEGDSAHALSVFSVEEDGTMTYYAGTTLDMQTMNNAMVGRYEMRPIQTDHTVGLFTNCYSVNGDAGKDDIHASEILLSYMLAEGPQKTMHIIHKNAIPLNKNAFQEFLDVNGKYDIISDYYLDVLTFEGEEQKQLEQQLHSKE